MKKQSVMAFRAAAVLSSLALASAFVAYRSGASAGSGRSAARPASDPQPVTGTFLDDVQVDFLLEETQKDRRVFSGSKSGIMFEPKTEAPKKVMGGSKRMEILTPSDLKAPKNPAEATPPPAPATQPK